MYISVTHVANFAVFCIDHVYSFLWKYLINALASHITGSFNIFANSTLADDSILFALYVYPCRHGPHVTFYPSL